MRKVINFFVVFSIVLLAAAANVFAQATFSPKTDFAAGLDPTSSVVSDFNNDGKLDIALTNSVGNTCSFYMNTTTPGATTPSFSIPAPLTTGLQPRHIAAVDLNGDGLQDLIIANATANNISTFLNTTVPGSATPSFNAGETDAAGTFPTSVAIADFNSDGIPDIVAANSTSNNLSVYLNFTFAGAVSTNLAGPTNFSASSTPTSVCTGDINGDGKPDIICSRSMNSGTPVSVFINSTNYGDPTPVFTETQIASEIFPQNVSIGDINNDGKPDLALANLTLNTISVLLNTTTTGASTPSFAAAVNFPAGTSPSGIKIADINNDGRPDICCTNSANAISVYLNITTPGAAVPDFTSRQDFTTDTAPVYVSVADFNNDYRPDIVSTNLISGNISVLINTMTLGVMPPSFSLKTDFVVTNITSAILNDMNGDGRPDVTTVNTLSNTISVLMNSTSPGATIPGFSAATNFDADTLPRGICASDLNTDGKQDIIVANENNSVSFFINLTTPGSTTAAFTSRTDMGTSSLSAVAAGDFNLDGQPDIAVTNISEDRIELLMNKFIPGDTVVTFLDTVSFSTGVEPTSLVVADVNNDGRPDIIVGNGSVASVSVFINLTDPGSSVPNFTVKTDFTIPGGAHSVSSADFNGDGKLDLYTANNFSNSHSVLFNTTIINDTVPVFTVTDYITGAVRGTVGDFNGDGKPDIAGTVRLSDLAFVRVNLTNPGASSPSFSGRTNSGTGTTPQSIVAGDINSDGKTEYLTSNPLDNTFSVLLNTADYPLPVELASFTASVSGNNVALYWSTASEENNSGFDIERKLQGDVWKKAGFVNGAGTTNQMKNYSFTESGLNSGRYSYRLKQVDFNGNYKYHELRNEVIVGVPNKFALMQNYPNPFNPSTKINYQLAINSFVTIKIYDISGREVAQLVNEIQQTGYYAIDFNAAGLSSGTYFYKLSTDKFSDVKKMVIVK